jgi:hypothetical protein
MRDVAEFEIPKRVVNARVMEAPEDFVKLDSYVGDVINGVANVDAGLRNVLRDETRNVVVTEVWKA